MSNAAYFLTSNTYNNIPFFQCEPLAEQFLKDLQYCSRIKDFAIHGYKVNPDHVHILIQCRGENISEIMRSLKTNSARNINRLLAASNDLAVQRGSRDPRCMDKYSKFQWQRSYHDHIIRNEKDYHAHIGYIQKQWKHHSLPENKHCFIARQKPNFKYTKALTLN